MRPDTRDTCIIGGNAVAVLRITNGPETGRLIPVDAFPCLIGRGGRSGIVIADPDDPPMLSREHAVISRRGSELRITDVSVNGTHVGERRLHRDQTVDWKPGQILRLGPTLRLDWPKPDPRPEPAGPRPPATAQVRDIRPEDAKRFLTAPETLQKAWVRVELNRGAAGPDNVTIQEFGRDARRRLGALRDLLLRERYQPMPPRLFAAPKRSGGARVIAILTIQDRIVQQALHMTLQPRLEPHFPACSYAYRPGSSAHDALRAVDRHLANGAAWIAETDITGFFDHIAHDILLTKLADHRIDPFVLSLLARCMAVGAVAPGLGLPQGAATAPLLSNLYLAEFDSHMLSAGANPVRYGDDLLFSCASRGEAQRALAEAEGYLRARLRLSLQAEKTRVVALNQGFTFLGFRFTSSGRRAADQALAGVAAKLETTPPEQAPAIIRGWRNYFGEDPVRLKHPEMQLLERLLTLFGGREDYYARQGGAGERDRFVACAGAITIDLLTAHLRGEETLAAYPLCTDGRVRFLVLDIDRVRGAHGKEGPSTDAGVGAEAERAPETDTKDLALDLRRICAGLGLPAFVEESGRKGHHVWLFFEEPAAAETARRLARLLVARSGGPRPGMRVEIFPRHTEWPGPDLGDAVKLPLGIHPATGRRCLFLDAEGEPIADASHAIERLRVVSARALESAMQALLRPASVEPTARAAATSGGQAIVRLQERCAVIRALAARAQQTGHLRHTHQLMLLYTAGRLGEDGARFIHRTISNCHNYDPRICQSYIDKLDAAHPPLSCGRIREWLEEDGDAGLCTCPPRRRNPLEGVDVAVECDVKKPRRRPQSASAALPPPTPDVSQWREVVLDMFMDPAPPEADIDMSLFAEVDESVHEGSDHTPEGEILP